jgi:hypothetical protein
MSGVIEIHFAQARTHFYQSDSIAKDVDAILSALRCCHETATVDFLSHLPESGLEEG